MLIKQKFEVIDIRKQKEVRLLLQKKDADHSEITKEKKSLSKQDFLVVTIIEGSQPVEQGLLNIVRNHFH